MERRVSAFQKWEAGRDRCRPRKTDDSGTGAWRRGNYHARRHDTGLLRARNPNRKGKNGTGCRAGDSRQPCRNAVKRKVPFAWQVRSECAALCGEATGASAYVRGRHSVAGASGAAGDSAGGVWRRVISRAALSSNASISLRHSVFNGGDDAAGIAFRSNFV